LSLTLRLAFSPHFHGVDALALVVPALLFYAHLRRRGGGDRLAPLLVAAPLLLLIDCYAPVAWPGGVRPFFVAMLVLLFGMVWALAVNRRASTPEAGGTPSAAGAPALLAAERASPTPARSTGPLMASRRLARCGSPPPGPLWRG
jgi:hypothetical protein